MKSRRMDKAHGFKRDGGASLIGGDRQRKRIDDYILCADSVPGGAVRFVNANDGAWEGIDYPALRAFSVQFDPVLSSGSKDANLLFDRFADLMKGGAL